MAWVRYNVEDVRAIAVGALCVFLLAAAGCPTYENSYSGTFRETNVDTVSEARAVEVDFFRYGGNASAILRFFEPNPVTDEPFWRQSFCTWTRSDNFNQSEKAFQLRISKNAAQAADSFLRGTFSSKERARVTLHDAQTGQPIIDPNSGAPILDAAKVKRISDSPDSNCDSITPFSIRPDFELQEEQTNTMPEGVEYDIQKPVFAMRWVGVESTENGFQIATNDQGQTRELTRQFNDGANALEDSISLKVNAPPEQIRVGGTETSYAIGHPVVVDQRSSGASPIVASALQTGRRPNAPRQADGSGKAVFFVQDDLHDLSENVLLGAFSNSYREIRAGEFPDAHFYVVDVDVDFGAATILEMHLPREPAEWVNNRRIPMKVTDRYIDSEGDTLPRIWIQ